VALPLFLLIFVTLSYSQLLPHVADVVRILMGYFKKCWLSELRTKGYSIVKDLLILMGAGMFFFSVLFGGMLFYVFPFFWFFWGGGVVAFYCFSIFIYSP